MRYESLRASRRLAASRCWVVRQLGHFCSKAKVFEGIEFVDYQRVDAQFLPGYCSLVVTGMTPLLPLVVLQFLSLLSSCLIERRLAVSSSFRDRECRPVVCRSPFVGIAECFGHEW